MTSTSPSTSAPSVDEIALPAPFEAAGALLDAVCARDFDGIAEALQPDATMSALLPRGFREWTGAESIASAFATWFGDLDRFAVADAAVGKVGPLVQMSWRLRVGGGRFEAASKVIEQQVFAGVGADGRIHHVSLLCSGFWDEPVDA
jgi:hypothetical protein